MICQQASPLLVIVGSSSGDRRIELRHDYMVVGREPTCDIWLDDPRVSRTHAALQCRGNAVYITDLGSSGGTFVDGSAVSAPPVAYERSRREAARTRGRWLCWTGLLVLAEGSAIAAITRVSLPRPSGSGLAQLRSGPSVAGVPSATLGLALAVIGLVLLLAGLSQRS